MKKNIYYFIILFLMYSATMSAQLKVKSNGDVKIGTGIPFPSDGDLLFTESEQTTEIRVFATSPDISRMWAINSVYSYAFGIDADGVGHIYSNVNNPQQIATFNSKGDFGIGIYPSYKLDVNGNIRTNAIIYSSDKRLKSSIVSVREGTLLNNLQKLNPVKYLLKKDFSSIVDSTGNNINDDRYHYGFIAQDVKTIFPDLVYEDSNGILGIDYVSFVPILIGEIKDQRSEIDLLSEEITLIKSQLNMVELGTSNINNNFKLHQNYPNPFTIETTIKYTIPKNSDNASILIFNLEGSLLLTYNLDCNIVANSSVVIDGGKLYSGIFIYSLIIDGVEVDSKRMILTN